MTSFRSITLLAGLAFLVLAALAIAGCGSSGIKSTGPLVPSWWSSPVEDLGAASRDNQAGDRKSSNRLDLSLDHIS
jgi:hypothetical protein